MSTPKAFDFRRHTSGDVHLFQQGKLAKTLKGAEAEAFLKEAEAGDAVEAVAKTLGKSTGQSGFSGGTTGPGTHLHGNGQGHAPTQFRRKTG